MAEHTGHIRSGVWMRRRGWINMSKVSTSRVIEIECVAVDTKTAAALVIYHAVRNPTFHHATPIDVFLSERWEVVERSTLSAVEKGAGRD